MLDISIHGDLLERRYASFIRERIPSYEQIWKRHIGNDGNARLIDLPQLGEEKTKQRVLFSQWHYSVLESIVCLMRIVETKLPFSDDELDNYLDLMTFFIAFQAHAGRIRDYVEKMGNQFNLPELALELEEYYKQRNVILHGCKIPFMIISDSICIPDIQGAEYNPLQWNDKMTWDEARKLTYKPIVDYMAETFNQLASVVNGCLSKLLNRIVDFVKENNIPYQSFEEKYLCKTEGVSGYFRFDPTKRLYDSSSFIKPDIKLIIKKDKNTKR